MDTEQARVIEIAAKVAKLVCDSELDTVMCAAVLEIAGQLIALDGHLRREAEYASPEIRGEA